MSAVKGGSFEGPRGFAAGILGGLGVEGLFRAVLVAVDSNAEGGPVKTDYEQQERSQTRTLAQKIWHWKRTGDCDDCAGLAHRREAPRCLVCGGLYADEDLSECRRDAVRERVRRMGL